MTVHDDKSGSCLLRGRFLRRGGVALPAMAALLALAVPKPASAGDWLLAFEPPADLAADPRFEEAFRTWNENVADRVAELARSLGLEAGALSLPAAFRLRGDLPESAWRPLVEAIAPLRWLEPNRRWQPAAAPDDPLYELQWGLRNRGQTLPWFADPADCEGCQEDAGTSGFDIRAEAAWDRTRGSRSVRVAVVDTGVDRNHPDLAANVWRNPVERLGDGTDADGNGFEDDEWGWDACDADGDPDDLVGHGTQVAAVAAARTDDGYGMAGVAGNVEILAVKFLGPEPAPSGSECNLTTGALTALDYVLAVGADVVNLSWGGPDPSAALREKLEELAAAGMVLVAAAGNNGEDLGAAPFYPAAWEIPGMLVVAAHTNDGNLTSFSNFGAAVHLAAPGAAIKTAVPALEDAWSRRNFSGSTLGPGRLAVGPVAGTDFRVEGNDPRWGLAELSNGEVAVIGDFQCSTLTGCDPGSWDAHGADLDQRLVSEALDASAWGGAVLRFGLTHDLGPDSRLLLEYSVDAGGTWKRLPGGLGVWEGLGGAEPVLDLGAAAGVLPTDLQIRFRLQTAARHPGVIPGGVYLYDLRWLRRGSDYGASAPVFSFGQGTSLAAPFVAGTAALMRSLWLQLSPADLRRQLVYRSARLWQADVRIPGSFRLDAAAALDDTPLLVWEGAPEPLRLGGAWPQPATAGSPVRFLARVADPAGRAGALSGRLELRRGDAFQDSLPLSGDAAGRLSAETSLPADGTYEYRFVVDSEANGRLAGLPAEWQRLLVGDAVEEEDASAVPSPPSGSTGCGCAVAPGVAAPPSPGFWLGLAVLWLWRWRRRALGAPA